ncbi:MAG: baseplate J/gp47 family protein [Myxococcota bacterium]
MPFPRPSLSDLIEVTKQDLASRLEGDPFLKRSFEYALSFVVAGLTHGLYGYIDWLSRQAVPGPDADDDTNLRWASFLLKPSRVLGTKARGPATWEGTDVAVLPAGTEAKLSDGTRYTVDEDGTVSGGSVTVQVTARQPGEAGNVHEGATITLSSPVPGIESEGEVGSGGLTGGTDDESIESVLRRLDRRMKQPPRGGGPTDFEAWALEAPGVDVRRAWEFPKRNGPGTVGLAFTVEDGPIPSSQEIEDVRSYILGKAPTFMRSVDMIELSGVPLTAQIQIAPNTQAVRDAVRAELEDLVDREAVPEQEFLLSGIHDAITDAQGLDDYRLVSPVDDVDPGTGGLVVFQEGSITFEDIP